MTNQIIRHEGRWETLAIDPGTEYSGYVAYGDCGIMEFGTILNSELRQKILGKLGLKQLGGVLCEFPHPRGQLSSWHLFLTIKWIGQLFEIIHMQNAIGWIEVDRRDVKMHLCDSARAKDKNIRQALIDMFGGESEAIGAKTCQPCAGRGAFGRGKKRKICDACCGTKKTPAGVLFGFSAHAWQALAILVTFRDGGIKNP